MPYGKMPPQAYTKETLQEAFEWWSEQPDELRSKIQDKDDLVGYYLKVNRGEEGSKLEGFTEAAKESFSSELKGLAKNLDAFEGYGVQKMQPNTSSQVAKDKTTGGNGSPLPTATASFPGSKAVQAHPGASHAGVSKQLFEPSLQMQFPEMSKPLVPSAPTVNNAANSGTGLNSGSKSALAQQGGASSVPAVTTSQSQFFRLDARSKASVAKAKEVLNLSSDEEALRALIALGHAKIKNLL